MFFKDDTALATILWRIRIHCILHCIRIRIRYVHGQRLGPIIVESAVFGIIEYHNNIITRYLVHCNIIGTLLIVECSKYRIITIYNFLKIRPSSLKVYIMYK